MIINGLVRLQPQFRDCTDKSHHLCLTAAPNNALDHVRVSCSQWSVPSFSQKHSKHTTNKMLKECIHDRRTPIKLHPVMRANTEDADARSIKTLDTPDTTESSCTCGHLARRFCTRSSVANCSNGRASSDLIGESRL
jgi:hypothetical protein